MKHLRVMMEHVVRKSNEIIFMKCTKPNCGYCLQNPIIATECWENLKEKNFKWPNPTASLEFSGHYKTYLETEKMDQEFLITGLL